METNLDVEGLVALGFFAHVEASALPSVLAETRGSNRAFEAEVHRLYHADAETLAEHGVRDFLGAVAPFLRRQGIRIEVTYEIVKVAARGTRPAMRARATLDAQGWLDPEGAFSKVESMRLAPRPGAELCDVTEDDWHDSDNYSLFLGEREIVVYQAGDSDKGDEWQRATAATLKLLDELLESHGSSERAWAFSEDNGLKIAFATPQMAELINATCHPRERLVGVDGVNEAARSSARRT